MTQLFPCTLVTCLMALNKTTHWRLLRILCPRTVFMMTSDHVAFASRVSRFTACSSVGASRPRRPSRYPRPQPANSTPTNARPSHTRDFIPRETKDILKFAEFVKRACKQSAHTPHCFVKAEDDKTAAG